MFLEYNKEENNAGISTTSICWGCENICTLKCTGTCAIRCMSTCANNGRRTLK